MASKPISNPLMFNHWSMLYCYIFFAVAVVNKKFTSEYFSKCQKFCTCQISDDKILHFFSAPTGGTIFASLTSALKS